MTNALRPSELFALKWQSFNDREFSLKVTELSIRAAFALGEDSKEFGSHLYPGEPGRRTLALETGVSRSIPQTFIFRNEQERSSMRMTFTNDSCISWPQISNSRSDGQQRFRLGGRFRTLQHRHPYPFRETYLHR